MCQLSPIAFHDDTIFCVVYEDQPYIPMRPIVENLGLDWSAQAAKFRANKDRWTVAIITTVAQDGLEREMLCIPIRKYPAWLTTLNPNKVKPELRPKFELYQAESDDALWNYWMNGRAERKPEPMPEIDPNASLTPDQQRTLQDIVDSKVLAVAGGSGPTRRVYYSRIWGNFNKHFRIAKYSQLPQSRLSEGIAYLVNMEIRETKELPQQQALPRSGDNFVAYIEQVEAFRQTTMKGIDRLVTNGLHLMDVYKFGPEPMTQYNEILIRWLMDVVVHPSALFDSGWRDAEYAIRHSPIGLVRELEKRLPDMRK